MFLIWLQVSWIIVLVGAEISHAYQNADHTEGSSSGKGMSVARTRLLALTICRHVVQLFKQGQPAQTTAQIADSLTLAPALVDKLSNLLVQGNILVRIESDVNGSSALQPARDIGDLTVNDVVAGLDKVGQDNGALPQLPEVASLSETLADFQAALARSDANRLMKDI